MTFAHYRNILTVVTVLTAMACITYGQTQPSPSGVEFTDVYKAMAQSGTKDRVMVFYFTASWCGYCRKMKATTFVDEQVVELSKKFMWIKVDTEKEAYIASIFKVQGLPTTIFVNNRGETLERRSGYISPRAMVDLLKQNVGKADVRGKKQQRSNQIMSSLQSLKDPKVAPKAVGELIALLGAPTPQGRAAAKEAIIGYGPRAWTALVDGLRSPRLSVRAAAYSLLRETTVKIKDPKPEFDSFGSAILRRKQADAWDKWVSKRAPKSVTPSKPNSFEAPFRAKPAPVSPESPSKSKALTNPTKDRGPSNESSKVQPSKSHLRRQEVARGFG